MKEVIVKLYQFGELSDKAKEKAREWWRRGESNDFGGYGELYEPAETAAKLLGVEFKTRQIPLMGGKTRSEPCIYWQLHVQGAGVQFEGSYSYRKGSVKAIKAEFGTDTELHRIAQELADLQKAHRYQLSATMRTPGRGYYVAVEADKAEEELRTLMRDFADWIYKGIEAEYDYRMSDENVDENILANEYDFREDGTRSDG